MKKTLVALVLLFSTSLAIAQGAAPVAGRDYVVIENGKPLQSEDGKVVVEEFFSYICPACNSFEPLFLSWQKQLPDNAVIHHIPATFRSDFKYYAGVFYAAKALGVEEESHAAMYEAVHKKHTVPGEGERIDENKVAAFYADFGVEPEEFLKTLKSFGVDSNVRRATKHMQDSKVPSTPTIVVNGRYLVTARSYGQMFSTAEYLIEQEAKRLGY